MSTFWCSQFITFCIIFSIIKSNTVLDDAWTPLSYDECTADGTVEVVGSGSQGKTCNFNGAGSDYMPALWTKKYLLAVSQDLYNGFHTVDDFNEDCVPYNQTEHQTDHNCGEICGWCFLINGPNGAAIYIANEIADIGAVGNNGRGINLHIDDDTIDEVRNGLGLGYDISYKKVPCPGTERGIFVYYHQYNSGQTWKNAVFFTPINYRIGVKAIYVRHGEGDSDRNWYRLPRDWTNRYRYESWNAEAKWLDGLGSIHGSANHFDMKIVSHLNEEIVCIGLVIEQSVTTDTIACLDATGQTQQFTDNGYSFEDDYACDGSTLAPSLSPTKEPSVMPTSVPTVTPTDAPSVPTATPTDAPSVPTATSSDAPSAVQNVPTGGAETTIPGHGSSSVSVCVLLNVVTLKLFVLVMM